MEQHVGPTVGPTLDDGELVDGLEDVVRRLVPVDQPRTRRALPVLAVDPGDRHAGEQQIMEGLVVGRYTLGMKTAVSIPDDLFQRADEVAADLGKSRSQLYQEALAEYLQRREPRSVTASYDAVIADVGREIDPWLAEAGRQALERNEW